MESREEAWENGEKKDLPQQLWLRIHEECSITSTLLQNNSVGKSQIM